jgi:hypothetical protein
VIVCALNFVNDEARHDRPVATMRTFPANHSRSGATPVRPELQLCSLRSNRPLRKCLRHRLLIRTRQRAINSAAIARCSRSRTRAHWSMAELAPRLGVNFGSRRLAEQLTRRRSPINRRQKFNQRKLALASPEHAVCHQRYPHCCCRHPHYG